MTYHLPDNTLEAAISIIRRQSPQLVVGGEALQDLDRRIYAVLLAVGATVSQNEDSKFFREALGAMPTDRQIAEEFRKIAAAPNPLDREICSVRALVRLNALAKKEWAERLKSAPLNRRHPLLDVSWDELMDWQRQSVREIARKLSEQHQAKITQGAPAKGGQSSLLFDLADIFLSATDQHIDRFELPGEPDSRFIQFAHVIAAPFFSATEVSARALSARWNRLKAYEKRKFGSFKAAKRQIRRRPNKLK